MSLLFFVTENINKIYQIKRQHYSSSSFVVSHFRYDFNFLLTRSFLFSVLYKNTSFLSLNFIDFDDLIMFFYDFILLLLGISRKLFMVLLWAMFDFFLLPTCCSVVIYLMLSPKLISSMDPLSEGISCKEVKFLQLELLFSNSLFSVDFAIFTHFWGCLF